ncbi:hypothetical protein NCCP691_30950 [Noviherbaspirillum aridicola]|uniref:Uncharacterized protein n=1 Tax=Noviherbaspirillum aridicola TaxID=2849687 RepID=A0ABQ4Q7R4_9BURK|nr:hypothetical protein NCCP691_30950 [Noviherbaspirillum aridicola]
MSAWAIQSAFLYCTAAMATSMISFDVGLPGEELVLDCRDFNQKKKIPWNQGLGKTTQGSSTELFTGNVE